jgi:16S rRNA (uracil1498-N3)-methyltransferase
VSPKGERRRAALAQVRVADPALPVASREEDHHLRHVLRARVGEEVVVTDGRGRWAMAAVTEGGLERASEVDEDLPPAPTALYLPFLKGERSEWALAKAVELGVATVVPLMCARAVIRPDAAARERVVARWRRVAAEAAGQCRRTHDLVVGEPVTPRDVPAEVAVAEIGSPADWRGVSAVAVGPEGGWGPGEWDEGRRRVGLGPAVLRTETAAVVAATLLAAPAWGLTLDVARLGHDEGAK